MSEHETLVPGPRARARLARLLAPVVRAIVLLSPLAAPAAAAGQSGADPQSGAGPQSGATTVGRVVVSVDPLPTGASAPTSHGYLEYRVRLQNLGGREERVELNLPEHAGGGSYVAVVEESPFAEEGLEGLSPYPSSRSVILGILERGER
jgi:hypothetical protein